MTIIFGGAQLERFFSLIGRRDVAAYHLADDIDACIAAFVVSRRGDLHGGLPAQVETDLVQAAELATRLREVLYRLPGDVRKLIDLKILSDGALRRIAADVDGISSPLEDLTVAVEHVRTEASSRRMGITQLEDNLIAAIAAAVRNRLNLAPSADPAGPFMVLLRNVLDVAAREQPLLAGARDRATAEHVGEIIAARLPLPEPHAALTLQADDVPLVIPDRPKRKPFVMG